MKAPTPSKLPATGFQAAAKRLALFTLTIVLFSGLLSVAVKPFVGMPLWNVFRRCVSVAAAITLWLTMRRSQRRHPFRVLGLGPWRPGWRTIVRGMLLGLGAATLLEGLYLATGLSAIAIDPDRARIWRTVLTFLPTAVLVSVLEELVFRGYVLQQLLAFSQRTAVWASSIVYAAVHLRTTPAWPQSGFELVGLTVLGWLLARSVLHTKQLYLGIGLHAGFAYWARTSKLLVEMTTSPSLVWLVGGTRLINGVGAWILVAGIGWGICRFVKPPAHAPSGTGGGS